MIRELQRDGEVAVAPGKGRLNPNMWQQLVQPGTNVSVHTDATAILAVMFVNSVKSISILFNTVTSGQRKVSKCQALARETYFCHTFNKYVASSRTSVQMLSKGNFKHIFMIAT